LFQPDLALVIGQGGLVGGSVVSELRNLMVVFDSPRRINWNTQTSALIDIENVVQDFFREVDGKSWVIFWCAGKGAFNSSAIQMSNELELFTRLLGKVASRESRNGRIVFVSSAGGIYGSKLDGLIDGSTPTAPNSEYGMSKLQQEESLRSFSTRTQIKSVICRLSTVYGSGQDMHKSQGLITHLCLSSMLRRPANIFVSLSTSRNYVFNQDAGRLIIEAGLQPEAHFVGQDVSVHRISAPQSHSIAEVVNAVEIVYKRKIMTANRIDYRSINYAPRFDISCSVVNAKKDNVYTPLLIGVNDVKKDLLTQLQAGKLQHLI
jgi:UDP-glucose 4-epimerase